MTAGSQGPEESAGGAPQDDDPFGYLYRPAEGAAGDPAQQPPAAPRTAYRPMEVGRAQYGQQTQYGQPGQYGQQGPRPPQQPPYPQAQQQPGYGEPAGQLPHQQSRYAERSRPQPGEDAPRGRGKGAVIGVVAVIAAVAIGAGIALTGGDGPKKDTAAPGPTSGHSAPSSAAPSPSGSGAASTSASPAPSANGLTNAAQAQPGGGAAMADTVKGAVSGDGGYLQMNQGSTATFTVSVPSAGLWKVWLHYGNATGAQVSASVTVNGQDHRDTTLKSWSGDPSRSWSYTWVSPQLQAGANTIVVSTSGGPVMLDQIAVTSMDVNGDYPSQGAGSPTG